MYNEGMETLINPLVCSEAELREMHQSEMHAFAEHAGVLPYYYGIGKMSGYWEMANRHMSHYVDRSQATAKELARALKAEMAGKAPRSNSKPGEIASAPDPSPGLCRDCGGILPIQVGPGRRAVRCLDCREKAKAPKGRAPKVAGEPAEPKGPAPERECVEPGCHKLIPSAGTRGRRPVRCPKHRAKHNANITAGIMRREYDHSNVEIPAMDIKAPWEV